jgi:uncharacterized protein YqeY
MELKTQLENSLKDAMRASDDVKRRTLRMVLASSKMAEIEKGSPLDDQAIMAIIQKEIKSRRESIQEAQKANRLDLESASLAEIAVLESYLPTPFSETELQQLVNSVIIELGATGPADMGRVIKAVMPRVQGRAAGDKVSQAVRAALQK